MVCNPKLDPVFLLGTEIPQVFDHPLYTEYLFVSCHTKEETSIIRLLLKLWVSSLLIKSFSFLTTLFNFIPMKSNSFPMTSPPPDSINSSGYFKSVYLLPPPPQLSFVRHI